MRLQRKCRLSFMLRRGQQLHLRTVVAEDTPASPAAAAALAARVAEELEARPYESESEWEEAYAEDEDKENADILGQVLQLLAQEAAAAGGEAAASAGDEGGEAAAPQGDDFAVFADPDGNDAGSQGSPAALRSEDGGALWEWDLEAGGSDGEGGDDGGGASAGPASPDPPSPLAAVLEQLGCDVQQAVQLCHQQLQVGADTAFQLDDLRTAAGCTRAEVKQVRQEMDARFTAIEKTLFYIQRQLAMQEAPPTQRRIALSSEPKKAAAAAAATKKTAAAAVPASSDASAASRLAAITVVAGGAGGDGGVRTRAASRR